MRHTVHSGKLAPIDSLDRSIHIQEEHAMKTNVQRRLEHALSLADKLRAESAKLAKIIGPDSTCQEAIKADREYLAWLSARIEHARMNLDSILDQFAKLDPVATIEDRNDESNLGSFDRSGGNGYFILNGINYPDRNGSA